MYPFGSIRDHKQSCSSILVERDLAPCQGGKQGGGGGRETGTFPARHNICGARTHLSTPSWALARERRMWSGGRRGEGWADRLFCARWYFKYLYFSVRLRNGGVTGGGQGG